jgi:hypothetical protein
MILNRKARRSNTCVETTDIEAEATDCSPRLASGESHASYDVPGMSVVGCLRRSGSGSLPSGDLPALPTMLGHMQEAIRKGVGAHSEAVRQLLSSCGLSDNFSPRLVLNFNFHVPKDTISANRVASPKEESINEGHLFPLRFCRTIQDHTSIYIYIYIFTPRSFPSSSTLTKCHEATSSDSPTTTTKRRGTLYRLAIFHIRPAVVSSSG